MEAPLWNYAIWTFDKILRTAEDWALDPAIIKRMHMIFLKTLKDPDRGQKIDLYWGHFSIPHKTFEVHMGPKTLFPS